MMGQTTTVKGVLTDKSSGESEPFATVRVFNAGKTEKPVAMFLTDEEGHFSHEVKGKGKFDIDASSHNLLQLTTEKTFYTPDVLVKNSVFGRCNGFAFESIRSFVDKMVSGEPFHVSLREAANVSLAILAIMESAESGKPVRTQLIEQ